MSEHLLIGNEVVALDNGALCMCVPRVWPCVLLSYIIMSCIELLESVGVQ